MTDRYRLIELFEAVEKDPAITCPHFKTDKTCDTCKYTINNYLCNHTERMVDYLLANGVIVPPCKVGQVVWVKSQWYKYTKPEIESRKVLSVQIYKNGDIQYHYKDGCFWQGHIGKTVFLTKEEAEAELEKRGKDNA